MTVRKHSMSKKLRVVVLGAMLLASSIPAQAQQPQVYRVGVLTSPGSQEGHPNLKGLRDGLREAGYLEGKNLQLNIPNVNTYDELRPIAKDYVEKRVAAIVTMGGTATFIARDATKVIPIIFISGVGDPLSSGLVKSLARPEANITGVAAEAGDQFYGKRLELFKETVPSLRRVTLLYNARGENPAHLIRAALIREIAPKLGLKLNEKPAKSVADIDDALRTVSKQNSDGIFVICSGLFADRNRKIHEVAIQKKLPAYECGPEGQAADALLFYDPDRYSIGHRGAWYVDKVLKGTKPSDLPVEQPMKFEFVINLKTAKQIGVTIPFDVLARANRIIR
jgi:putative tryptophan/tyrosine transport system substrate-binding protein